MTATAHSYDCYCVAIPLSAQMMGGSGHLSFANLIVPVVKAENCRECWHSARSFLLERAQVW